MSAAVPEAGAGPEAGAMPEAGAGPRVDAAVASVPKAELHCHLEGAARPELVRSLAREHGIDLSHVFDADGRYRSGDFSTFLATYDEVVEVFRRPEDYQALARDHYLWLAEQGAIYGEIFVSPSHANKLGFGWPTLVEAIVLGMHEARDASGGAGRGIEGRIVATGVRHFGPLDVEEAIETVLAHPHPTVTGFGLAGDERQHHAADFSRAFQMAREAGLGLTAHAGEHMGPESVTHALDQLGVGRVGHGVRAAEDPALVDRIVAERVVLEVCPGSNVALGVYDTPADHPFGQLWDAGARVTLNSDDPPFFHTDLAAEYAFGTDVAGLAREDLLEVTRTAIEVAFVDENTRAALLARVDGA